MQIIKLNAIGSTNEYAKDMAGSYSFKEPVVIWAKNQTAGRGQRGTKWASKEGESLTFSILLRPSQFTIADQFSISMLVSVAIAEVLNRLQLPQIKIKWPNDILADGKKIGGILIENSLKGNQIDSCVIGFGLNVNQTALLEFPKASSLRALTGKQYDLEEVLHLLAETIISKLTEFKDAQKDALKNAYLAYLFRKDKPSSFNLDGKKHVPAIIRGIDDSGALIVQLEDEQFRTFGLKEIELLY